MVISDCLDHEASTVYYFRILIIQYLKQKYSLEIKEITYFCDGVTSQYKNKSNFINLAYHLKDSETEAECHFFQLLAAKVHAMAWEALQNYLKSEGACKHLKITKSSQHDGYTIGP